MMLLGYLYGLSSERRLAEECRYKLAFKWFLGYDLDELTPDHSIFSKSSGHAVYRVHRTACRKCPNQGQLCRAKRPSIVSTRADSVLAEVEALRSTAAAKEAYARRKYWVETVFGELKTSRGLRQAWLRGNWKVQVQALLAFAVHNIKQMIRLRNGPEARPTCARGCPSLWSRSSRLPTDPVGFASSAEFNPDAWATRAVKGSGREEFERDWKASLLGRFPENLNTPTGGGSPVLGIPANPSLPCFDAAIQDSR